MDRHGYRVWSSRLAVVLGCLFVFGMGGKLFWDQMTKPKAQVVPQEKIAESAAQEAHALDPVLKLAREALEHHRDQHHDYTGRLTKREVIGTKLQPESKLDLKLMYRPNPASATNTRDIDRLVSVYLKGVEPKSQAGREVIWQEGENGNKMTAHEAGLLGMITVQLAPTSSLAMVGNRYPITEIGIEKLLHKLIDRGERDRKLGPATVRTTEDVILDGIKCRLIEIIHEEKKVSVEGKEFEFEFHLAQIYMDPANQIPIRYASYAWPKKDGGEPEVLEEYTYENLQFNVGLTDKDFDPKNANYHF